MNLRDRIPETKIYRIICHEKHGRLNTFLVMNIRWTQNGIYIMQIIYITFVVNTRTEFWYSDWTGDGKNRKSTKCFGIYINYVRDLKVSGYSVTSSVGKWMGVSNKPYITYFLYYFLITWKIWFSCTIKNVYK